MRLAVKKIAQLAFVLVVLLSVYTLYQTYYLYQFKIADMDDKVREISGIEFDKKQRLWATNDGGGGPFLHQVDTDGQVIRSVKISNAKNLDWEDMTQNDFGHFFIGDFGNNDQKREWLTIYKIENPIDIKGDTAQAEIIKFNYPAFSEATEKSAQGIHDLEAFVSFNRSLYLFTKNRTSPFDGQTHIFKIGDHASNFAAQYISSFTTCTDVKLLCWVTSAALSPDRTKLVLLDSQRLWLFENWSDDDFFSGDVSHIDLGIVTQKESVTFYDNQTVIFTDENFKGMGGNAYKIKLDEVSIIKREKTSQ